jgi:transposase InsO family protein
LSFLSQEVKVAAANPCQPVGGHHPSRRIEQRIGRIAGASIDLRWKSIAVLAVPIPIRQGKARVADQLSQDLFVVPTIGFKLLYGFVIVRIDRRDLVWINVTTNPTAEWIARQITEAFPWDGAPDYMIRDRDRIYGAVVTRRLRAMGIRDKPIAPASPWQNGFAERLIGSIRRECVDHIIVLGEAHLHRILKSYARYYNETRTHLALDKDAPLSRTVKRAGRIFCRPVLGGLHHEYVRI